MSRSQIRIIFFCLGNICRSPLAEALFRHKVAQRGLADRFHIESAGTSAYHLGEAPDPGSQQVAYDRLGLDISHQQAQQLAEHHHADFDYLVAMDRSNKRHALRMDGADGEKILLLRNFEPEAHQRGTDVPDPYGGGNSQFDLVYDIVDRCCDNLLEYILSDN